MARATWGGLARLSHTRDDAVWAGFVVLVTSTDLLSLLLDRGDRGRKEPLPIEFRLLEDPRLYA
jgi:hypothetical protein